MTLATYMSIAAVLLTYVSLLEARVSSRAQSTPACYRNFHPWPSNEEVCKNPLYSACRQYGISTDNHLCCGPDHYCCRDGMACCRKATNAYEVVGVVFGGLAWLAIFGIVGICVGTHVLRQWKIYFKKRKIHPK